MVSRPTESFDTVGPEISLAFAGREFGNRLADRLRKEQ